MPSYGLKPANVDLYVSRGASTPIGLRLRGVDADGEATNIDLTGAAFTLSVAIRGTNLFHKSTDGSSSGFELVSYLDIDPDADLPEGALDTLVWTPTEEESREIPRGRIAEYEIEYEMAGQQTPVVEGRLIGIGGLNDD